MDPLAEKYYSISPSAYCNNNPIKYVDPDGRFFFLAPLAIPAGKLIVAGVGAVIVSYTAYRAAKNIKETIDQSYISFPSSSRSSQDYTPQNATSPEYDYQRKKDREAQGKHDKQQKEVAKSIDTNISGNMPNGDPTPKRNLNGGGSKVKVVVGGAAVGGVVRSILELTNPDPS